MSQPIIAIERASKSYRNGQHLALNDLSLDIEPATFVASFNRPNLTYRVVPKDQPLKQVIDFVRRREHESGIIYCASRAATERLAEALAGRGFAARAYHAGLGPEERTRNQEQFLRDDVEVLERLHVSATPKMKNPEGMPIGVLPEGASHALRLIESRRR